MSKIRKRLFTLNNPVSPRINTDLAVEIGFNESIVLLQIEFWISISNNFKDGVYWTYQSTTDMQEKSFPFLSPATINRTINSLITMKLIKVSNHNKARYDKTRWFTLNFEEINKLNSISIDGYENKSVNTAQNELIESDKQAESTVIESDVNQNELDESLKSISEESDASNQNDSRSTQNESRSNQNDARSNQNDTTIPEITTENTTENLKEIPSDSTSQNTQIDKTGIKRTEIIYLVDKLIAKIRSNYPRQPLPEKDSKLYDSWCSDLDRLNRLGPPGGKIGNGYSYKEILVIINWCQDNMFWKKNILSAEKLRIQIIKLEAEAMSKGGIAGNGKNNNVRHGKSDETIRLEKSAQIDSGKEIHVPDCDF